VKGYHIVKAFLIILGFIALVVLSSIWSGFVLSIVWEWFMVPAFHLPQLSVALAIGISLTIRMVVAQYYEDSKDADKEVTKAISSAIVYPLIVLIFGYVVHQFV